MRNALVLIGFALLPHSAFPAEATLEQILAEVRALSAKVDALEKRLEQYEEVDAVSEALPRAAVAYAAENPPPAGDKNKWYENLRIELRKADVRASGDWVKPEAWDKIATKMKPDEVIAILGEPTDRKFSIRKDTDEILIYKGDINGDGEPEYGEVRIHNGKVRRFQAPAL